MKRREFIALLVGATAIPSMLWPHAARAQQPEQMRRIGFLGSASPDSFAIQTAAFRQGLKEAGYIENETVAIEYRWAQGHYDRLPALAAELVARSVAVIVAPGINSTLAAKQASTTLPIVMIGVGDPLRTGLVDSLAHPSGNVTGNSILGADLSAKRLELLQEAIPKLSRMGFLWNPSNASNEVAYKNIQVAASAKGVMLESVEITNPNGIESALDGMLSGRPDALIVTADPLLQLLVGQVVGFATKNRLPTMFQLKEAVLTGGLMAYGASLPELFHRGAFYVDKILKGAKPSKLPVEQPTKFELVINLKTAKVLGLEIPDKMLALADEVIE